MSRKQSSVVHFYIEPESLDSHTATFSRAESDHILKSFRLYVGDKFLATDGIGNLYQMQLDSFEDRRVKATIIGTQKQVGELAFQLTVGFGIPQLSKADQIIDQCTQLGATRFIPISSKNSKSKLTGAKSEARVKRWRNVAISATKQSLRSVVPEIQPPQSVDSALAAIPNCDAIYIGSPRGKALNEIAVETNAAGILLLTGPEEGFSRIEEDRLIRAGATPVSLGSRRLRTELAPVVLAAIFSNRNS